MEKLTPSFLSDFFSLVFKPKKFLNSRLHEISQTRIFFLGFFGLVFGLLVGMTLSLLITTFVINDFGLHKHNYEEMLKLINLTPKEFIDKLNEQKYYCLILIFLSPVIGYMAPHIFGGACFFCFKLVNFDKEKKLSLAQATSYASIAMASMFFYALPVLGPIIAPVMVSVAMFKALSLQVLQTFSRIVSIIFAMYITFFLASVTLQALAFALAHSIN